MIGQLTGAVASEDADGSLVLDVGGVGYDLLAPLGMLGRARANASGERPLSTAIGLAPRRLGKADLALPKADLARADKLRTGLDLGDWSIDQLARVALMAASHKGDDAGFAARFDNFCTTAEINELIALWSSYGALQDETAARSEPAPLGGMAPRPGRQEQASEAINAACRFTPAPISSNRARVRPCAPE